MANLISTFIMFTVLLLSQVLVLSHIHLLGYATPLLQVYLALSLPRHYQRWLIITICFVLGLSIDIFFNTPGVGAGAMTFIALMRCYILEMFVQKESDEQLKPSIKTLGFFRYLYYSFICILLFCLAFYTLEAFTFFQIEEWLLCIGSSTLLTWIFVLVIDYLRV